MKLTGLMLGILVIACSCVPPGYQGTMDTARDIGRSLPSGMEGSGQPDEVFPACARLKTQPVKVRLLYEDYYGTMLTSDRSWLNTPGGSYRWGIANEKPLSMAYFAAYVKPAGKYARFRARIYIDKGIKDKLYFAFRAESRDGEVIKNLAIRPGETRTVDLDISGVKRLFIGTELRINHDTARKIVIGEPEFYTCK